MPNNIEEKKDAKTCPCGCGNCGCVAAAAGGGYGGMRRWGQGYGLLKILIGIIILLVVFWIGVHVGEFSNELRGSFGRGGYGYGRMIVNPGGPIRGVQSAGGAIPPVPTNATSSVAQ